VFEAPHTGDYFDRTVVPLRDANGTVTSVMSLLVKITDDMFYRRQAGRMAQVLDESGEAILSLSVDGCITSANRRACELYGYSHDAMIGMESAKLRSPGLEGISDKVLAAVAAGETWRGELQHVHQDGHRFWAAVTLSALKGPSGDLDGVSLIALDITERKDTERRLADTSANFRQIVEYSPIGIALVDMQGRWLQVNPSICEMLGYSESEMLAIGVRDCIHPEDLGLLRGSRVSMIQDIAGTVSEKRIIRKDGAAIWVLIVGTLVNDANDEPHHYVCQMLDISDRKRVETRLRIEADMDPLTETLNRRRFSEVLTQAIAEAAPTGQLSLLFIDLDNFKAVNDTFGHQVGDDLLRTVASVLRDNVRATDAVGRHGGDEFVVLLDGTSDQVARGLADKLAEVIAGIGIPANGQVVRTRASIGVAQVDARNATTAEEALTLADRAMYAMKMRLPRRRNSRFS
jgi:diguanylate cyclase (GGDEF)-like protein/PAS domain S-box-containing protein